MGARDKRPEIKQPAAVVMRPARGIKSTAARKNELGAGRITRQFGEPGGDAPMGLPRKGSRSIIVDDTAYRWVVSAHQGYLRLIVVRRENSGQRLVAWLHHHDSFVRDPAGKWHRVAQLRSISPALVRAAITLALERGWLPGKKGGGVFDLWDAEYRFPTDPPGDERGVQLVEFAREVVGDLRYDVSVDVEWRRRLFHSQPGQRFEVHRPNEYGLHFAAFFDGWAGGMWVIGIECVEFPHVLMHTFNGSAFL